MSILEITLLVIAIVLLSVILICIAVPPFVKFAKKKGWNIPAIIQAIYNWLNPLDTIADILVKLNIPGATIFDKIIHVAREAVSYAEQIARTGQIESDQRREEARKAILIGLKVAGLSKTEIYNPDIQRIIEIGLESAVNWLGHKETATKTNVINGFGVPVSKIEE